MGKREQAIELLEELREVRTDTEILEELIFNNLSSDEAFEALDFMKRMWEA